MVRLSHIASESRRQVGRLAETRLRTLQQALSDLCEGRWQEIRGAEPAAPLALALWSATPPLSDLYLDLCGAEDMRLQELLDRLTPARGLAVLALAEIERGDMEGVHLAYESMMILDTLTAAHPYTDRVASTLRGGFEAKKLPRKIKREPLGKALAILVDHIGRHDLKAVSEAIRLLASESPPDDALEQLRAALLEAGIQFTGIEDDHISFDLHGRPHKPVRLNRLLETLLAIRQARLG
jgi:hypothetical protein